jgi:eukaryotic-like serine/threonine-protein kinase
MRIRLAEGDTVAGYRLERRVGAGGFGEVFMALRGSRRYALKFISLQRFAAWGRRELAVLVHVRHPNIVRLLGHFEWPEDEPEYLVLLMEYVEGLPLYDWAKEENPTARQVARVMSKLARALDVLHQQGVLHRDFKGENVLVRAQDTEPVLVDFGSAGWAGAPRVTGGVLAPSTLHYRSPESVRFLLRQDRAPGERYLYTVADDLYSLGVALYVLLTDAHPFDGPEDVLLTDIVKYIPKAPHMVNVRVPQALSELCMHLLDKDPRARLESALTLSTELEVIQQGAESTWDIPLCYGWSHDEATTEDVLAPAGEEQQRLLRRWIRRKPRRGRRPLAAGS